MKKQRVRKKPSENARAVVNGIFNQLRNKAKAKQKRLAKEQFEPDNNGVS